MLLSRDDYLRLAALALDEQIAPALPEGPAQDLAALVAGALAELHKRDAVLPGLREKMVDGGVDLLGRLEGLGLGKPTVESVDALADRLHTAPIREEDWQQLIAVLDEGSRRILSQGPANDDAGRWLRDAAEWELSWYEGFAAAPSPVPSEGSRPVQVLTAEKLECHLAQRLSDRNGVKVTEFRTIVGGFSNETYFFTLESDCHAPEQLVVRKNAPWPFFSHWAHDCAVESRILTVVADAGLPVPRPMWLFTGLDDVDGNFYVMSRGMGRMTGTLAGASETLPEKLLFSLAEFLARLHSIPAERFDAILESGALPASPGGTVQDAVRASVESMREVWEKGPRFPSPGEAFTIDWLLRNVPANINAPSVVHTDCFVHNFLVVDDEIETVVDWEAAHLGDPAEDLAYVKDQVSLHMDWDRFLAHYRASGGPEIDEDSLDYYKCLLNFRNYFGSNIGAARIPQGYNDIRMIPLGSQFFPLFMKATIEATRPAAEEIQA